MRTNSKICEGRGVSPRAGRAPDEEACVKVPMSASPGLMPVNQSSGRLRVDPLMAGTHTNKAHGSQIAVGLEQYHHNTPKKWNPRL